ncbi:MAG: response regulator [Bdellovibrio sp.]|nr:response regulator [Bdellovibrio sp.]
MKLKCLIVEDVLFIREIYKYSLRAENYQIVGESGDGIDALEKIKAHQPDIVILDLILPLKNGLDVLKEAHVLSPNTRYLVISSLDDVSVIGQAKALGAIEYIVKPFTRQQLTSALHRISENYSEVQNG